MVVVAARAVVVASIFRLVAVDEVGLHVQRVLVVVAALRADHVVELAAALVRVFLWVYRRQHAPRRPVRSDRYAIRTRNLQDWNLTRCRCANRSFVVCV